MSDGKDINVTLEDAVVSWEELRIIQGGQMRNAGNVDGEGSTIKVKVHKTAEKTFAAGETIDFPVGDGKVNSGKHNFPDADNTPSTFQYLNMDNGERGQVVNGADSGAATIGEEVAAGKTVKVRFFWEEEIEDAGAASEIVISPNTFPGTLTYDGVPSGDKNANQFCELLEAAA